MLIVEVWTHRAQGSTQSMHSFHKDHSHDLVGNRWVKESQSYSMTESMVMKENSRHLIQ